MKLRCLIVDDEPIALDILQGYIEKLEGVELAGRCSNAIDAFTFIGKAQPDIIFIDIEMPQLSGITFAEAVRAQPPGKQPLIVFVTAYERFALQGYDLEIFDYLLKPVPFERFVKTVSRANALLNPAAGQKPAESIFLKADKRQVKVELPDILYIEGLSNYVKVRTRQGEIVTYQKLSYFESTLPPGQFIRVHKSYIVAVAAVLSFDQGHIRTAHKPVPIGRSYRKQFTTLMNHIP